jgi:FtsH-binding integral membrane protein
MENKNFNYSYDKVIDAEDLADVASRKFLAKVFTWMFVALGISAFCAFEFFLNPGLMALIVDQARGGFTTLGYVAIFAPLAFSMVISFGLNRLSYPVILFLFIAYAATVGISLSIFGLIYTASSIFTIFLSAAVVFGIMAIAGYFTTMDLTKFGSILTVVFFGALAVGLVNFFLGSPQLSYILSFVFVVLMVGLTAYYMQTLKRIGAGLEYGSESSKKLVIMGAFVLYTTFINLFTSMMRLFGSRR